MKKFLSLMLALFLLVPVFSSSVSAASNVRPDPSITVYLQGEEMSFEIDPIQTKGYTFVQFTTIFKALGLEYTWDGPTKTIHAYKSGLDLELTIDSPFVFLNDKLIELDVAPFTYNGRTLVPLRFVSEATGLNVEWNGQFRDIYITGEQKAPSTSAASNIDELTFGLYEGESEAIVKGVTGLKNGTKPYGDTYLIYDNYKLFGHNSELAFAFIYDELSSISYLFGNKGTALKDEKLFTTYNDIYEGVTKLVGAPDSEAIYEYTSEGLFEEIDYSEPQQSIVYSVNNGDYVMETIWEIDDYFISLVNYQDDNGRNLIELSIVFQ